MAGDEQASRGASAEAIDQLAIRTCDQSWMEPVDGADDLGLDGVLDLPLAKQAIPAWGLKNDVAALARGSKVASWPVGAPRRRGLGEEPEPVED